MNDKKNTDGSLMTDGERLTAIGSFVRKTSLDEIPQLINVLRGDMSLIGPRPLLPKYLPLYNEIQKLRHEVLPNITGRAQVHGRNAIGWSQKFELDVWYVDNCSFISYLKIRYSVTFTSYLTLMHTISFIFYWVLHFLCNTKKFNFVIH